MSREIVKLKVRLPVKLINQINQISNEQIEKVVQKSIAHYVATYAVERTVGESVTQYVSSTEEMFEKNFDQLANLLASLSYVNKFNNNILNAIFINNGGKEQELEELYNQATDVVQKYFHFEEGENGELLPIMKENDQLKIKIQELENQKGGLVTSDLKVNEAEIQTSIQKATDEVQRISQQKEKIIKQKKELVAWVNGLILYIVQNYSRVRKNDALMREYVDEHPKPDIEDL